MTAQTTNCNNDNNNMISINNLITVLLRSGRRAHERNAIIEAYEIYEIIRTYLLTLTMEDVKALYHVPTTRVSVYNGVFKNERFEKSVSSSGKTVDTGYLRTSGGSGEWCPLKS